MESMLLLFGALTLFALIGGIASFFALFSSKKDPSDKIATLERELESIKNRLRKLETAPPASPASAPIQAAPVKPVDTPPAVDKVVNKIAALKTTEPAKTVVNVVDEAQPSVSTQLEAEHQINTQHLPDISQSTPNFIEKGINYAKNWLFGGNTLVRAGVVILFIGVAFLLKFAADKNIIPIELRLFAVALLGAGLLAVGWQQREKRNQYAWALQGGGIGVLYLTIFAAFRLYQLIPSGLAFALLIAVALLSAAIAVLQSAMPLAMLGFTGGFLAPIFTSTGHGSHVALFSYYLVLNLAIALVAFYRSWRPLNVLGFAFTFIIGTLWGANSYIPEHFASTEPFLIVHFLLFTAIAVIYAHKQSTKATDYVDATLVFGTPMVGFSLQYALLRDSPFGLAYSALALGIFYMALAWWVLKRKQDTLKFLGECFLALGVGFLTLTLPLALDGRWTSAAWAVEGVGLLWVGLKQNRSLPTFSGLALQLLAALAFSAGWGLTGQTHVTQQNLFLGVAFIALAGWACGALWHHMRPNSMRLLATALAVWGWAWWAGAGITAIDAYLPQLTQNHAVIVFMALTSLLLPIAARALKWSTLAVLSTLLLPVLALATFVDVTQFTFSNIAISAHFGWVAWPIGIAAYIALIARNHVPNQAWLRAPIVWISTLLGVLEWQYHLGQYVYESAVWREIGWAIVPMLMVAAISYWQFAKKPVLNVAQLHTARTWAWVAVVPIMLFLVLWFMVMSVISSGYAAPLPYVPLLNPLDISLAGVLLVLLNWQKAVGLHFGKLNHVIKLMGSVMAFILLNGLLLRTLHHWLGTPFQWAALFDYPVVQMALTFLWGLTAFALMLLAHQRQQRILWIAGAALMGLVVAKIFLLDLSQRGSIERIVSFIGAGLMLLVMGYFAPLPPAQTSNQDAKEPV